MQVSFFKSLRNFFLDEIDLLQTIKTLRLVFLGGVIILISWLIYFALVTISMPYQIEYREGAAPVLTQILLRGGNPFSGAYQPAAFNNYGIGYNLLVLPFAAFFGNTLALYRGINFLFIIFSCLLVFWSVFRVNRDRNFGAGCAAFVAMALLSRGGIGAFPGAFCEFLFLAAVLIPLMRSFDLSSLLLSAGLSVIAYYSKPYFVLSFGVVASYLFLFVSKKKGLLYSLSFMGLFIFSYLVVRYFLKYYFIDTFIGNLSNTKSTVAFLLIQLQEWVREFYPSLIAALALLLFTLVGAAKGVRSFLEGLAHINLRVLDQPLFSRGCNYFAYFFFVCFLAFSLVLGQYSGGSMTYLFQLVVPSFFLWIFQSLKPRSRLGLISLPVFGLNMIMFCLLWFNPLFLQQKDSREWARLFQYVDQSKNILNTPVIASEMVRIGMQPVDSGQTEFYYHVKPYADSIWFGPNYDVFKSAGRVYKDSIHSSVISAAYDEIIVTDGANFFVPGDMNQYYSRVDAFTIFMPQTSEQWNIEIWKPLVKTSLEPGGN